MMDPVTSWFELVELHNKIITCVRKDKEITDIIIDKSSAQISILFNKQWLSRYPRANYIMYDNGTSKFKFHFRELFDTYGIGPNAIFKRVHGVLANMMCTSGLVDMDDTVSDDTMDSFFTNAARAIRSTHHTV
ncbi:hypothetical protein ACHAWF_003105 [Thalassiosira exigua]